MAEFGCEFSDDAELPSLRLQYEVVCLGLVFDLLSVLLHIGAAFCRFLPSWMGCDCVGRVVRGGLYRYRDDTNN